MAFPTPLVARFGGITNDSSNNRNNSSNVLRTSKPAAVRDQVFDKKSRKRVANPHELVENLAANQVENQVCSWLE